MDTSALFVSSLALLFTDFSFWWMNWRKGKIIVSPPLSMAGTAQGENGILVIQFPLVFYNDGAASQIICNLRLKLEQGNRKSPILYFNNTLSNLASNDDRQWSRPFAVEGRKTYSSIFVFQRTPGKFLFEQGNCRVILEGRINKCKRWKKILEFNMFIHEKSLENINSGRLLTHDIDPDREWD